MFFKFFKKKKKERPKYCLNCIYFYTDELMKINGYRYFEHHCARKRIKVIKWPTKEVCENYKSFLEEE